MPFAQIDHSKIYYAERPGAGRPVVFLHGAAANHLVWGAQLRELGQTHRAIALDLPGHGRSDPPGRDTIEGYRDDLLGLLDALAIDRAVVVGHSMGGAIALALALAHPDRVAGLGLVGTGARLRVLPAILEGIQSPAGYARIAELVVDHSYAAGLDARLRERALAEFRSCPPAVAHADFSACDEFDVMARLGEIRAPTLVVCGSEDRMTPVKYSEFLAAHIPRARLVVLEGASHSAMLEQPDALNEALADFLTTL